MSILNECFLKQRSSPTLVIAEKASALKQQGYPVINLSIGEPDTLVPLWVQESAIQAIEEGDHVYAPVAGKKELKKAVLDHYCEKSCQKLSDLQELDVLVSTGAKQTIYNALRVSLRPGDEVIVPAPYWVSYPMMVDLCGGTPVVVPCESSNGFILTPENLKKSITPRTRWIILNSPNNPTGAVYSQGDLEALASVLEQYPNIWILSDEIYEELVYEGKHVPFLKVAPYLASRTLWVSGVSKSYAMTGWRIGYGVGPKILIKAMTALQSQSTSGACCIAQTAAYHALSSGNKGSFLLDQRALFLGRRDQLLSKIQQIPGLSCRQSQGAFYAFVDCKELLKVLGYISEIPLVQQWLEECYVSCVPGTEFGAAGYVRFSYAQEEFLLSEAMDRLGNWIQNKKNSKNLS